MEKKRHGHGTYMSVHISYIISVGHGSIFFKKDSYIIAVYQIAEKQECLLTVCITISYICTFIFSLKGIF